MLDRKGNCGIGIARQGGIHDALVLGIEIAAGQSAANRETAVAIAEIVELGAEHHGLMRMAGARERVMKLAVLAVPFVAELCAIALRTGLEAVCRRHNTRFPMPIAGGDCRPQRRAFDPGAGLGDVEQILDGHRRDTKAALALSDHEVERAQLGQGLPQRRGAEPVFAAQPFDVHLFARPEFRAQNVLAEPREGCLRQGGCLKGLGQQRHFLDVWIKNRYF